MKMIDLLYLIPFALMLHVEWMLYKYKKNEEAKIKKAKDVH